VIRIASGTDVRRLLYQALALPELFERVMVCSPFLDDAVTGVLVPLARVARRTQCGFKILTRPGGAEGLLERLPGHPAQWRSTVVPVPELHAKAYLAIGRRAAESRAIVTSANLTRAGLGQNLELGVLATPASDAGRKLVSEVREFLERLVDVPRRSFRINDPRRAA